MSTSLGRLVLDVAANAAGFERDMQKISKSAKKEFDKVKRQLFFAQRDLDAARAKVTRLATAFGALSGVGLAVAVRQISEFRQETDKMVKTARVVGVTVEQLQELRFAAQTAAGVANNQLDIALQRFARRAGEAANGTGELVKAFNTLGISARDQNGNLKSQVTLLKEFADGVANAGSEQEQLALAFKAFDSEGARLVNLLRLGSAGIDDLRDQFARTGATIDEETSKAVERFNDALALLSNQFSAFRNNLLADLIAPLADFAEFLARSEEGQELLRRSLVQLGEAAKVVGFVVGVGFAAAFAKAVFAIFTAEVRVGSLTAKMLAFRGATGAAATAAVFFGRAVSLATGPIGIIITILGTLAFTYKRVQDEIENTSGDFDEFRQRIDAARKSTEKFQRAQLESDLSRVRDQLAEVNAELDKLEFDQVGLELSGDLAFFPAEQGRKKIAELRAEQERLRETADALEGNLESLSGSVTRAGNAAGGATSTLEGMRDKLESLRLEMAGPLEKATAEYISQIREFSKSDLSFDEINEAVSLLKEKFESAREEIRTEEFERLEKAQDEAAKSVRELVREQEEYEQQVKSFRDQTDDMAAALGGAAAVAELEFVRGIQLAQQALADGITDVDGFRERVELLKNAFEEARSASGALNQIGANFAQAILNGQGIQGALGSSLTAFGGQGIGNALDSADLAGFFETAFKDGISAAFEDSEFKKNSAAGFALALGQAVEGNIGQAAFTAIGNALGGEIGALIGSIIGDLVFGESVPKFQVRGRNSNTATDAGTDRVISTAFGADLEIAFRGIEDTAKRQIVRGYSEFLSALSGVVRDPAQQSAIARVISEFGVSSRSGPDDLEGQLELLFGDILGTFDEFTQSFVRQAETLDGQVQRLDDILSLANLDTLGRNFGLTFEELALVLDDVAIGGESIIATFNRLEGVIASLDQAAALTGNSIADTREGIIRFGADLVALFGDDAGLLGAQLDRAIGAIFSDAEISQQEIASSRQRISDLLTSIGVDVTEDVFTQSGFREIFESLFGNLSPDDTAALIEAGAAFADLIDAEEELARIRGESVEQLTDDWQRAVDSIAEALNQQALGPNSSLTPLEQLNTAEAQLRQAVTSAQGGDLDAARAIPDLFQQAIGFGAGFFGTSTDAFGAFESDLRSLLGGLELNGISVEDSQLASLQEIASYEREQVEILKQIAGGTGGAGEFAAPSASAEPESRQSANVILERIDAKLEMIGNDQRTIGQFSLEEQQQIRELLLERNRQAEQDSIRNPRVRERLA